jgi:glycine betaine/choline ABC-type transport system substrate-binding protein
VSAAGRGRDEENPEMEDILKSVFERLNADVIREPNGRVDMNQQDPEDVAEAFLTQVGLI